MLNIDTKIINNIQLYGLHIKLMIGLLNNQLSKR